MTMQQSWIKSSREEEGILPENIPTAVDTVDRVRESVFRQSTAIDRTNGGFSIGGFLSSFHLDDESLLGRHLSAFSFFLSLSSYI